MKTKAKLTAILFLMAVITMVWGCKPAPRAVKAERSWLPQDVLQSCTVTSTEFNSWFASGTASQNGTAAPANSILFPHQNNCDFYKWSQQMFLWITSPVTSGTYQDGNTVMESPVFYTVTPADAGKHRKLIPHTPGTLLTARSNISQNGPDDLPVVFDKEGTMFEIETKSAGEKDKVWNEAGKLTEVNQIVRNGEGNLEFIDNNGKVIKRARPLLQHKLNSGILRKFSVNGQDVLIDANGNEVNTELGQAGSNAALIAQTGSLVYYISFVNDVYAYFLSGVSEKALDGTTFPTTAAASTLISSYARKKGWPAAPDSNALAIEIKTSWVETTNLPDSDNYITIDAMVPVYAKSSTAWVPSSQRRARLAMIGMHVVGSVAGHPEMIWATFEHNNCAPNMPYAYIDSGNVVKNVPADTGSHWLLNGKAGSAPVNVKNMVMGHDSILSYQGAPIAASNTQRNRAWGVASDVRPNTEDATPQASNSEIISINNAVRRLLPGNDVRKNYFLVGATWTFGGAPPSRISYNDTATANGVAIGTSQLANSSMETYVQGGSVSTYKKNGSCFGCHAGVNSLSPDDLSHVFDEITPLPSKSQSLSQKK